MEGAVRSGRATADEVVAELERHTARTPAPAAM
jgi:hypothetical protein